MAGHRTRRRRVSPVDRLVCPWSRLASTELLLLLLLLLLSRRRHRRDMRRSLPRRKPLAQMSIRVHTRLLRQRRRCHRRCPRQSLWGRWRRGRRRCRPNPIPVFPAWAAPRYRGRRGLSRRRRLSSRPCHNASCGVPRVGRGHHRRRRCSRGRGGRGRPELGYFNRDRTGCSSAIGVGVVVLGHNFWQNMRGARRLNPPVAGGRSRQAMRTRHWGGGGHGHLRRPAISDVERRHNGGRGRGSSGDDGRWPRDSSSSSSRHCLQSLHDLHRLHYWLHCLYLQCLILRRWVGGSWH